MKTFTTLFFSTLSFFISLFLTAFLIQHTFLFIPTNSLNITYIEVVFAFLKYLFTDWIFLLVMIILGIYAYTKRHSIADAIDINIIGKSTTRTYIVIGVFITVFAITGSFGSHFPLLLFLGLFSALVFPIYCFFVTYFILRKKCFSKEGKHFKNKENNYMIFPVYLGLVAEIAVSVYLFSYYKSITEQKFIILFLAVLLIFFVFFNPSRLSKLQTSNLLFLFSLTLLFLSVQINAFSGILFSRNLATVISCLMFLLTCSVIYFSMKKERMIEKNKFEQKTREISQQQLGNWNKQNTQLLHLKHDCLHALTEINRLLQSDQNEEASMLLEQFSTDLLQNEEKIYCNDIYINSLLQFKTDTHENLILITDIHLNSIPSSLSLDICLILSELIDSSVSHSKGAPTSNIHISEQAGTIIIRVTWDHTDHSSFQSDFVNDIIHHYHGVMDITDGDTYTVSILLLICE